MAKLISLLSCAAVAVAAATIRVRDSACTSGSITSNGRNCTVSCGLDHPGGDYSSMYTADFQTCINTCLGDQKCTTAQYSLGNSYCYLKNATNGAQTSSGINSVVCQGSLDPPAKGEGCTSGFFTQNGRSGAVQCNVDYPGGDYASQYTGSLAACESLCAADSKCLTSQYVTSTYTCYLKNYLTQSKWGQSGVNSLIFNPTSTPSGCMPYAPISPYMISPGLEQGYSRNIDINYYPTNGWSFTAYGKGNPPYGYYSTYVANGTALEGCNSFIATPSGGFDPRQTRSLTTTVQFQGLQTSKTYNFSMKAGPYVGSYYYSVPPQISITLAGSSGAIVQSTSLCGWQSTGVCPIQGIGGASGQKFSGQFTYTGGSQYININLVWPYGATNSGIVLDDVEIVPA